MSKALVNKRSVSARSSRGSSMIESLESRQMLSAVAKLPPLVSLSGITPGKILAGKKPGYETVTVRNLTAVPETETVSVALTPSLDGVNAAGSYGLTGTASETLTLKKHGSAKIRVAFVPPITLAAGKYHTLASVDVAGDIVTATAPGTYTLTLPPLPTTTPSLVGRFAGLITATSSQSTGFFGGGTSTTIHQLTFIWNTSSQTTTSLTGLFAVGEQQSVGTMEGYELTNGVVHYTFSSPDITYTMDGKVSANGTVISGLFKGVLVDNLFKNLGGKFKIVLEPT